MRVRNWDVTAHDAIAVDPESDSGLVIDHNVYVPGVFFEDPDEDWIDLALVQISSGRTDSIPLADTDELRVGDWVGSVGHGVGGIWTYNTGMVSNILPVGSEHSLFQTQIPLNPGSSGGPIFDRRGEVVGIVVSGLMEANSINFGIKIDVALQSLSQLVSEEDSLVIEAPDGAVVFVDGACCSADERP